MTPIFYNYDDVREGDTIVCIEADSPYSIGDEFVIERVSCRTDDEGRTIKMLHYINEEQRYKYKSFEIGSLRSKQFALSLKSIRKRKLEQINGK